MTTQGLALTVTERDDLAPDVVRFRLRADGGARLPDWTPGAHIALDLPPGPRCYSLCGDRWDAHSYQIAVRRDAHGRGGSRHLHDQVDVGDRLLAAAPVNNFPMVPAAEYLFIAGGIGITALIPMIEQARRMDLPWRLIYASRSRADMPFVGDGSLAGGDVTLWPDDERGLLDVAASLSGVRSSTVVYVCGPQGLVDAVHTHRGQEAVQVRSELFTREVARGTVATAFDVILGRDGRRLRVPADRTLFEVLAAAGAPVRGACLQGICGSCETRVLDGEVAHGDLRPRDGSDQLARPTIFPCVSRAASPELVLDL